MEMRKIMNIEPKDPLEMSVEGDSIIFKKYESDCHFCSNVDDNILYKDKLVCNSCLKKIASLN